MTTGLGTEVNAPAALIPATPVTPPLISLLTSATVDDGPDGEWINGVAYLPEGCDHPAAPPYWWACPEEGHAQIGEIL